MCFVCGCMMFGLQRIIKNVRPIVFDTQPVVPTKHEAVPRPAVGNTRIRSATEPSVIRGRFSRELRVSLGICLQ